MGALSAALLALALGCTQPAATADAEAPLSPSGEISWTQALALIRSGAVRQVMQSHDLAVTLRTERGDYTTREPAIDDVIRAVREQAPNAGEIAIATE